MIRISSFGKGLFYAHLCLLAIEWRFESEQGAMNAMELPANKCYLIYLFKMYKDTRRLSLNERL